MVDQTHQSQKLEMLGISDVDRTSSDEGGDFQVRCPRCDYTDKNLTRAKAAAVSHKTGCPDCDRPTDDLGAADDEDPEPLTNVGRPLAVSPMA